MIRTIGRADWKQGARGTITTPEMIERLHDFEDILKFELAPRWAPPK